MIIIISGILIIVAVYIVLYSMIMLFFPTLLMILQYRMMSKRRIKEIDEGLSSLRDLM